MLSYRILVPIQLSNIYKGMTMPLAYSANVLLMCPAEFYIGNVSLLKIVDKSVGFVALRSTSLAVKLFTAQKRLFIDVGFSHFSLVIIPA
jgi:hypothetical protein